MVRFALFVVAAGAVTGLIVYFITKDKEKETVIRAKPDEEERGEITIEFGTPVIIDSGGAVDVPNTGGSRRLGPGIPSVNVL